MMRTINEIIVHCAATPEGKHFTVEDIDRWHRARGWNGCGYHFVVYLDGSVHEGRPVEKIGAHVAGRNATTIGVCYIGGVSANDARTAKDTRTPEQRHALTELLKRLVAEHDEVHTISGHHDYAAKACPCFPARAEYAYLTADRENMRSVALLQMGSRGWEARALQGQLDALGYSLVADGVFGRRTRDAVMSLQADAEIAVDGKVGPETRAAIRNATPVDHGARSVATVKDIKEKSRIVKKASDVEKVAVGAGAVATAAKAASETGVVDGARDLLDKGEDVRGLVDSGSDFLAWAWSHWWILIPVIAGIVWWQARGVIRARLEDHRSGKTT